MNPLKNLPFYFKPIKYNYQKGHDGVRFIIIHDTGNRSKGAGAQSHFNYFNGRYVGASADYFVDDGRIIQTVSDFNTSWHCGDNQGHGRALNGAKNRNSIGIEICINSDSNYELAVANTLELVKNLQKLYGVPDSRVQRHYDVSRKRCPGTMISNNWARWRQFKNDLKKPMILSIDTRKNSIAKTVSGGLASTNVPTGNSASANVWYGVGSNHNTKSAITQLQKDLVLLGHSVGSYGADGVMGDGTEKAIMAFQKANKLKVDGQAGSDTLKLIKKQITKPKDYMERGDKGENVRKLQEDLVALGGYTLEINGEYDAVTRDRVTIFQRRNNLKDDGIAGKETLDEISKRLKATDRTAKPKEGLTVVTVEGKQEGVYGVEQNVLDAVTRNISKKSINIEKK